MNGIPQWNEGSWFIEDTMTPIIFHSLPVICVILDYQVEKVINVNLTKKEGLEYII